MGDYKTRMIEEYTQLLIKTRKLRRMLEAYCNNELDFKFICPIVLLEAQLHTMCTYLDILELRADIEGIKLPGLEEV